MALLRSISTDVRRGWVICNIIFAALPFGIVLSTGGSDLFASTLSYCYAFLVVGTYYYYRYIRTNDSSEKSDTIFWFSVLAIVLFLLLLLSYYLNPRVSNIVNSHIATTIFISIVILIFALYLAFRLNMPMISIEEGKDEKAKKREDRKREKARGAKQDALKGRVVLESDGREGENEIKQTHH